MQQSAQKVFGGAAGGNGEGRGLCGQFFPGQRRQELLFQRAQHAYAVFQLAVALVIVLPGQGTACAQEQLVSAEEQACTELLQTLSAVLLGNVDDFPGSLAVHRPELGQALAVFG